MARNDKRFYYDEGLVDLRFDYDTATNAVTYTQIGMSQSSVGLWVAQLELLRTFPDEPITVRCNSKINLLRFTLRSSKGHRPSFSFANGIFELVLGRRNALPYALHFANQYLQVGHTDVNHIDLETGNGDYLTITTRDYRGPNAYLITHEDR